MLVANDMRYTWCYILKWQRLDARLMAMRVGCYNGGIGGIIVWWQLRMRAGCDKRGTSGRGGILVRWPNGDVTNGGKPVWFSFDDNEGATMVVALLQSWGVILCGSAITLLDKDFLFGSPFHGSPHPIPRVFYTMHTDAGVYYHAPSRLWVITHMSVTPYRAACPFHPL